MRSTTLSALFFAASIALAIASPARNYYYEDDEYPDGKALIPARHISLANAPFYYQPRTLEVEALDNRGRKYTVVKKRPGGPGASGENESKADDESDESSEEEDEEEDDEDNENNEEQSMDVPPWQELFPEEDKNTGNFATPGDSEHGGGSLADLPGGQPAPQSSSGGLMSLLGFGSSNNQQNDAGGPPQQYGQGPPSQQYGQGPPPQYRQGPPPQQYGQGPPPYQAVRARASLQSEEEPRSSPRSGGAVIYDGYRYIPIKPVHVRVRKRQAKKIVPKPTVVVPEATKARSLVAAPASTPRQKKKQSTKSKKPKYVFVPVDRHSREIRFDRDQHGFQVESGPIFAPSEIWRWEGPGGRKQRRDNRPTTTGLYYAAPRPHRGSSPTIRFAEDSDY